MSKVLKRGLIVAIVFVIFGVVNYLGVLKGSSNVNDLSILLIAGVFAVITILLLTVLYPKRGTFFMALLGLIAGYFAGKFVYEIFNQILPFFFTEKFQPYFMLAFAYLGFYLTFTAKAKQGASFETPMGGEPSVNLERDSSIKLLDTSVIIDGRIADIAETGFLSGTMVVPKFVLDEIQALADSQDPLKRSRARRGLDILNTLKDIQGLNIKITSRDFSGVKGVDAKLVALAKTLNAGIMTNDYNLNKVAKLEGLLIFNINDLANALKPILMPGEQFKLDVIKIGKEPRQGLGYLQDGTMVVVADGKNLVGTTVLVKVTSVLQTSAGRIIFTDHVK